MRFVPLLILLLSACQHPPSTHRTEEPVTSTEETWFDATIPANYTVSFDEEGDLNDDKIDERVIIYNTGTLSSLSKVLG